MAKTRIYIFVQLIGIIVLICGYFLSDQPDSLSVMHFLIPTRPALLLFTKATKIYAVNGGLL